LLCKLKCWPRAVWISWRALSPSARNFDLTGREGGSRRGFRLPQPPLSLKSDAREMPVIELLFDLFFCVSGLKFRQRRVSCYACRPKPGAPRSKRCCSFAHTCHVHSVSLPIQPCLTSQRSTSPPQPQAPTDRLYASPPLYSPTCTASCHGSHLTWAASGSPAVLCHPNSAWV